MTDINPIGTLNKTHGVCGFASALYAIYERLPNAERANLPGPASRSTWLALMMHTFLEGRQRNDPALLGDIQRFTQTFRGFGNFTVGGLMTRLKSAYENAATVDLSVAMTPNAVVAFLQDIGFQNARCELDLRNVAQQRIVGLCEAPVPGGANLYNNLKHWVYFANNRIYSYGNQYPGTNFTDALDTFNLIEDEDYAYGYVIRC